VVAENWGGRFGGLLLGFGVIFWRGLRAAFRYPTIRTLPGAGLTVVVVVRDSST